MAGQFGKHVRVHELQRGWRGDHADVPPLFLALEALPATFSYTQARRRGLSKRRLYRLRDEGLIEPMGRGLYRRRDAPVAVDVDLLEIARRASSPTLCLTTALARHGLTDEIPSSRSRRVLYHPDLSGWYKTLVAVSVERLKREVDGVLSAIDRGARANDLESSLLDFKELKRPGPTDRDRLKAAALDLAEAAACMANGGGGALIVGVADGAQGSSPPAGVPDDVDLDDLRHRIWQLTTPPLVVSGEERRISGSRLFVLYAEAGFDLVRVGGKLRERIGRDCVPVTPDRERLLREDRNNYDWSAEPTDLRPADVVATAEAEARRLLGQAGDSQSRRRAALALEDLLRECGVLTTDGSLTRAGALLFCPPAFGPAALVQYVRRRSSAGPLIRPPIEAGAPLLVALAGVLREIDAANEITPVILPSGVQLQLETIPRDAVRESIINGLAHRDYRQPGPLVIEHSPTTLVVTSPGELVFGVTEDNLLTHVSKPRNPAIANALRVLRLAEKAGTGVDTMIRAMVRAGHRPPTFLSRDGQVRVVLDGGAPVARIASLIATLPDELRDDTDAVLTVHYLRTHATVDAPILSTAVQKSVDEAASVLRRLSDDRYDLIEPTREARRARYPKYRFRERVRAELGTLLPYHRNEQDEIDRRVIAHVREYGTVSNQTVQNLLQIGRPRASAILRNLSERGILQKTGDSPERGPTVRYEAGGQFPSARPSRRR